MSEKLNLPEPDPDAQTVLSLMDGFRASKAVFTAVSLGVFDHLHESSATCEELAQQLEMSLRCPGANTGCVHRIATLAT